MASLPAFTKARCHSSRRCFSDFFGAAETDGAGDGEGGAGATPVTVLINSSRWLSSALNKKPNYPEAREALIALLLEMGRKDEAEQVRQEAQTGSSSGQMR